MKNVLAGCLGTALVVAGLAAPVAVALQQRHELRGFHAVREGVLYRSAQLPVAGLRRAVLDQGIRTVVNLRDGTTAADQAEEAWCLANGVNFVRIPPLGWAGVQGTAPVEAGFRQFLEVMRDPANHPVLVHCYRGIHRTGGYVAIYRVEFEGWSVERAVEEMVAMGYTILEQHLDVCGYLASYHRTGKYPLTHQDSR
jgi:tyrosine-protein phosphatase SIW14